jgi:lysylphosphatidylglycerol synthetase-like protein (DUF2156 family)
MPNLAIAIGAALVLLGVGTYWASDGASITALIPAFFGLVLALLGVLGTYPKLRRHMMHVAAALCLLAFLGTVNGVLQMVSVLSGVQIERPRAAFSQAVMAVLSLAFVIFAVRSFIIARRERALEKAQ